MGKQNVALSERKFDFYGLKRVLTILYAVAFLYFIITLFNAIFMKSYILDYGSAAYTNTTLYENIKSAMDTSVIYILTICAALLVSFVLLFTKNLNKKIVSLINSGLLIVVIVFGILLFTQLPDFLADISKYSSSVASHYSMATQAQGIIVSALASISVMFLIILYDVVCNFANLDI